MRIKIIFLCTILLLFTVTLLAEELPGPINLNKSNVVGLLTRMNINNIDLPLLNDGSTGNDGQGYYPNGQTSLSFLYSGGFATSGFVNGQLRTSWVAHASLLEEWIPGKWGMDPADPLAKFYEVEAADGFGSQAYIDWADAVSLGADFQDLNGDGIYDPNTDRPDMLGDKVIWCVINDNTVNAYPGGLGTEPLGLEVHQHVWAFARQDLLGDVIFFRYRLLNPTDNDIDDLIFTVWQDPDLGDYQDDLIGCDTVFTVPGVGEVNSLGFIYNDGADPAYGNNPPAFGIDFFQGPIVESPGDTAYRFKGPFFGVDTLPNMTNLPMTSFMYYVQGGALLPDPRDPNVARNYQEGGKDWEGNPLFPPDWGLGGTPDTDPRFIFSGDPVAGTGWRDGNPADKRFMVNCGPFQLASGDTQDIVVAYIVSQGDDALNSVTKLRETDILAQRAYDANFSIAGPPPPPKVTARTFDKKIELVIDLHANGTYEYDQSDKLFNRQVFEAIQVYQFRSPNTSDVLREVQNARVIQRYDIDNKYGDLFVRMPDGSVQKVWSAESNIDTVKFQDPRSAVIKLTITTDAFNNNLPLVNNKKYFFGATAHSININAAQLYDVTPKPDDWILSGPADFLGSQRAAAFLTVTPGASEFTPFRGDSAQYSGTRPFHDGAAFVEVVDQSLVTGHDYEVSFFGDGTYWRLTDLDAASTVVLDSVITQADSLEQANFPLVEGIQVKVSNVEDRLDTAMVVEAETDSVWLDGRETGFSKKAVFHKGIDMVKFIQDLTSFDNEIGLDFQMTKAEYFPVKIVFDTQNIAKAYYYNFGVLGPTTFLPLRYGGMADTYVAAYDVTDPESPRQLNIVYNAPNGQLQFLTGNTNMIMIMNTDYEEGDLYDPNNPTGREFREDAYVIMNLQIKQGSSLQAGKMTLLVKPNYPNSDADKFRFSTSRLVEDLSVAERRSKLDQIKVVPNPYFAYSTYETSYDQPQIKFIHLDRGATVRIFNLAGQLVKTLRKTDDSNELAWDLRNESRLKIASGMYIAHIEVPGVGEKILKFGVVQREERIDRF